MANNQSNNNQGPKDYLVPYLPNFISSCKLFNVSNII